MSPLLVALLKLLASAFAHLPLPVALALGRCLGWFYGTVVRYHRAEAREAIARAFPEKHAPEVRAFLAGVYRNVGLNAAEFLRALGGRHEDVYRLVRVEGEGHVQHALARGKGVLALVSHCGNWEYLAITMAKHFQPSGLIIKELKASGVNQFLIERRNELGIQVFERRGAYRRILKGLKHENLLLGFVLDQNMIDREGVFVDFFGRPACTSPGLAQLAAHAGSPVVPMFIVREGAGRHVLRIQAPLEPPASTSEEAIRAATQRYTDIIEAAVREHPDQWIWMHRRWRTRPPEEAGAAREKLPA